MGFKVFVAGPMDHVKEREQMNDFIYALQSEFGFSEKHDVRLIVDIPRNTVNGCGKQIDGVILKDDEIIIMEMKALNGDVLIRFDTKLEKRKKEDKIPYHIYSKAQSQWKVDGVTISHYQNPIDQATGQRTKFMNLVEAEIRNVKGFNPKRKIKNWIVVRCNGISYESEEIPKYLKANKPWLKIMQQKDLIKEMNFLGETREPLREDLPKMFEKVKGIVNAEDRPYNRWLSERPLSEYFEVTRIPYLDYIIESKNSNKILPALKSIENFRLRAYSEDLVNLFYRSNDAQIKDEALRILINWEYEGLEDILVFALEGPNRSLYYSRALKHLSNENLFPTTIQKLESILKDSYELQTFWEATASIKALKNSGVMEACEVLQRFLNSNFGEDPCKAMLNELESDADIIRTRFNGNETSKKKAEILTEAIRGLGQCGNRESVDYLLGILKDFPYGIYRETEQKKHDPSPEIRDYMYASVKTSCLGNIFLSTLEAIGNLWDERSLDPLTDRFSIIHNGIVNDESRKHPLLDLYIGILQCLNRIGDASTISFLSDRLDEFPHPEVGQNDWFWKPREEIVGTIADIRGDEACETLINLLRKYKEIYKQSKREHEYHPYNDIIINIINHLGEIGCRKAVGELIILLDENSSDPVKLNEAIRVLGRMKATEAFDKLMTMFLEHEYGDYRALEDSLVSIDPKGCEDRLLEKYKDASNLPPKSQEVSLLERVATVDSADLMLKLVEDPNWHGFLLPKKIHNFMGNEDVARKVKAMLDSDKPHQRAFAIEMFALSEQWGNRTDKELVKYEDDVSPLVREMVMDIYAYRKNLTKTLKYLDDPDSNIRYRCYRTLHMFTRDEVCNSIIVCGNEWIDIHNVIITDGIIAFCKHYWLYDSEVEDKIDDELGVFYFKLEDIRNVRHVTAILMLDDGPISIEFIYLEMKNENVDMKFLIIPESKEQIKGRRDFWISYKPFVDKLKKDCINLREDRKEIETMKVLFKEVLSSRFLGSDIGDDIEIKFRF